MKISRLTYLSKLEDDITSLCNERSVRFEWLPGGCELFRFRNVLNEQPWYLEFENETLTELHKFVDGDNMVLIRKDLEGEVRISSRIIHELLDWFRRVQRAVNNDLITREDLTTALHRQILSFARNGRYVFLRKYLCPTGAKKSDFDAIRAVCVMTFKQYKQNGWTVPAKDRAPTDEEFLRDVGITRAQL